MREIELGRGAGRSVAALLAAVALGLGAASAAMAQLDDARRTENQTVQEGAETQKEIDKIDDQRSDLFRDYKQVLRELEKFRKYNAELRKVIADQEEQKVNLAEQIERVGEIDKDVVPLVADMLAGLEQFIKEDVPFLMAERNKRINDLKALMPRSDITVAEKFRRVLEAYQIENDYGRSIEAYQEDVAAAEGSEEGERVLNYLRIGRVALFRQTPKFQDTQMWDQSRREWVNLPGHYSEAVRTGRNMADKIIPPNLLVLPVIVPTQSAE